MTFSNPVVGGENGELIRASIKSPGFLTLVQGWIIRRDGSAEFNNILIRGGAIVGGSITVGPAGMPQVVIDSDASSGFVEFPTNDPAEVNTAIIEGAIINSGLAFESLALDLRGPSVNASEYAFLRLESENQDGSGVGQSATLGVNGSTNSITVSNDNVTSTELYVDGTGTSDNYPKRIVRGRTNTTSVVTAISKVTNTEINNSNCTSTQLENGVAYEVAVQIQVSSSSGTAASGTQGIIWRLWDGNVGTGTVLGSPVEQYKGGVGTASNAEQFKFIFNYGGTTGSKTLRLSALHFAGTDNVQALGNTRYIMTVTRIGDPSKVINL